MIRRLLLLLGGCAAFCLLVGLPARHLGGGDAALVFLATALGLSLVPAIATLVYGERALRQSADRQLILVLGGSGVRMAFVLLSGWTLYQCVPYYQQQSSFLIWLAVGYLFTLALDMTLLLSSGGGWRVEDGGKIPSDSSPSSLHSPPSTLG